MSERVRLDVALVNRGFARSRQHASALISERKVLVDGHAAVKPSLNVSTGSVVVVDNGGDDWVSRGAHKLLGACAVFEPQGFTVAGKRCVDAGASTGGFTEVLLSRGAAQVVAVDVGFQLLAERLRSDSRVKVVDRTNVRELSPDRIGGVVDVVVADLSFISLRLVLPALLSCLNDDGDMMLMVKPQFEVGKGRLGGNGVVREPSLRQEAVVDVVTAARKLGLRLCGVEASPLPGPAGNVEYFVWLRRFQGRFQGGDDVAEVSTVDEQSIVGLIYDAVSRGPQ